MADTHGPYQQDPFTHIVAIHFPSKKKPRYVSCKFEIRHDYGVWPGQGWEANIWGPCSPTTVSGSASPGEFRTEGEITKINLIRQEHGKYYLIEEGDTPLSDDDYNSRQFWFYSKKTGTWASLSGVSDYVGIVRHFPAIPPDPEFGSMTIPGLTYGQWALGENFLDFGLCFNGADTGTGEVKTPGEQDPTPELTFKKGTTTCNWEVYGNTFVTGQYCAGSPIGSPFGTIKAQKGTTLAEWRDYGSPYQGGGYHGYQGVTHHEVAMNFSLCEVDFDSHTYKCVGVSTHRTRRFVWLLFEREDLIGTPE